VPRSIPEIVRVFEAEVVVVEMQLQGTSIFLAERPKNTSSEEGEETEASLSTSE